ncbi:hypothetical protein BCEN4_700014 [Burkholderia cenocepacia]|nr:hypothetical protein BCEN4_700014 [Burkholderia cenocepacia]
MSHSSPTVWATNGTAGTPSTDCADVALVSVRNGGPDKSVAMTIETHPMRLASVKQCRNSPDRTGQSSAPVRQFIPVRRTRDSKSTSHHMRSCAHRMRPVSRRR